MANYFQLRYCCAFRPAICMPLSPVPKHLVLAPIIFFCSEWRIKSNKVFGDGKRGRVLVASQNLMCVFNMHLVAIFILILSKKGFKTETTQKIWEWLVLFFD